MPTFGKPSTYVKYSVDYITVSVRRFFKYNITRHNAAEQDPLGSIYAAARDIAVTVVPKGRTLSGNRSRPTYSYVSASAKTGLYTYDWLYTFSLDMAKKKTPAPAPVGKRAAKVAKPAKAKAPARADPRGPALVRRSAAARRAIALVGDTAVDERYARTDKPYGFSRPANGMSLFNEDALAGRGRGNTSIVASQLAHSQRSEAVSDHGDEAAYLYGFFDPDHASRGPVTTPEPTILASFRTRYAVSLGAHVPSATGSWPTINTPRLDAAGGGYLVITPFLCSDSVAGSGVPGLKGGYWMSSTQVLGDSPLFNSVPDAGGVAMPLNTTVPVSGDTSDFNSNFPGLAEIEDAANTTSLFTLPFRTVGLAAVLTVTEPALTATGSVVAGDNSNFFGEGRASSERYHTTTAANDDGKGSIVTQPTGERDPRFLSGINSGVTNARLTPVGAFESGSQFSAHWLPSNDLALVFANSMPMHRGSNVTTGNSSDDNAASDFVSSPMVLFGLQDLNPAGSSLVVDVTWSVEIVVRYASPIGFLMNQARMMNRYVVDWPQISCCIPGGRFGEVTARYLQSCSQGEVGFEMAVAGITREGKPMQSLGMGAPSSTAALISKGVTRHDDDDVYLGNAARINHGRDRHMNPESFKSALRMFGGSVPRLAFTSGVAARGAGAAGPEAMIAAFVAKFGLGALSLIPDLLKEYREG